MFFESICRLHFAIDFLIKQTDKNMYLYFFFFMSCVAQHTWTSSLTSELMSSYLSACFCSLCKESNELLSVMWKIIKHPWLIVTDHFYDWSFISKLFMLSHCYHLFLLHNDVFCSKADHTVDTLEMIKLVACVRLDDLNLADMFLQ